MDQINEKEWEAWCIENQPIETGCIIFHDHREVWAKLEKMGKEYRWRMVE